MDSESVRNTVATLLRKEGQWRGPLAAGDLDQHLDSLQRLSLVVAIEDHFRICFEPADEERIRNVDDLVRSIVAKLESRA